MRVDADMKNLVKKWYNIIPDLDFPVPPLVSNSGYPVTYNDLQPFYPSMIIEHELDREKREIQIPQEILELYASWRPTPLHRAAKWEKILDTPARIFFKHEGTNPAGGHEMNTALPQAYFASREKGTRCLVTATGDGEWGAALTIACNYFGLQCKVFMVRSNYMRKPYGRHIMELLGATVIPSPSNLTKFGQKGNTENPNSPGSIGIALSEAFEEAATHDDTKFAWGTVMNHVLLHQTIIGQEAKNQLKKIGVSPDIIISAVGGGSGFGGLVFPFFPDRTEKTRFIAVETASAPSLTRGQYAYDYSDAKGLAFMLKMYTLGHGFVPPDIRAGDMRYHGISPAISAMYREKKIEARAYRQHEAFPSALSFTRAEGLVPSPKSAYALKAVMDEALACREKNEKKDILFVLDANSNLDLDAFKDFMDGSLETLNLPHEEIAKSLSRLPAITEMENQ